MSSSGEPLELQLQRERVARTQVEAALEVARLQLIEMEHALRQVREDATACLAAEPVEAAVPSPVQAASALSKNHHQDTPSEKISKQKPRRAASKSDASSLVAVARAAEAIEKRSRQATGSKPAATTMSGMMSGSDGQPIVSSLDLFADDHRAIVCDFIEHLQTRLSKMQACYGSGSLTELKWHVNWISINAARAGFNALTDSAKQLEDVIEQQLNARIPELLDAVIQLGERVAIEPARR